jgi:transcriptional regulator with XRE-family HTH domain
MHFGKVEPLDDSVRDDPNPILRPNMDYARALRISRAVTGLQQKDIAERSGIGSSHISLIESGKRKPSVETLDKLSRALGMPGHLFMLLAAEPKDLKISDPSEMQDAAESLARLLFHNGSKPRRESARRSSKPRPLFRRQARGSSRRRPKPPTGRS